MKDHPEFLVTNYELEILGTIRNVGKTEWERIELQMEFFDAEGKFVDEASGGVTGSVKPGEVEHFKLTISNPSPAIRAGHPHGNEGRRRIVEFVLKTRRLARRPVSVSPGTADSRPADGYNERGGNGRRGVERKY